MMSASLRVRILMPASVRGTLVYAYVIEGWWDSEYDECVIEGCPLA